MAGRGGWCNRLWALKKSLWLGGRNATKACYKGKSLHMLCRISIFGGLRIMMGQHDRSEELFYYFRPEDQVPENHRLRLIEKHISFAFVHERLKASSSETGRPSIDPERLLRILLIGYLYSLLPRPTSDSAAWFARATRLRSWGFLSRSARRFSWLRQAAARSRTETPTASAPSPC
jgi:hypothetical protein